MALKIYTINMEEPCPRCGSLDVLVAVYHFGNTHKPYCKNCGLHPDWGDHEVLVKPVMTDFYINYRENNK